MKRDFMGLSSDEAIVIKEGYVEGQGKDSGKGCGRRSNFPLPTPYKASDPFPQFMPVKDDDQPSKDFKMQASSMMMSHLVKTRFFGTSQDFGGGPMNQQFHGGAIPLMAAPPPILPCAPFFAGTTDQWMNPKATPAPAQLTIFYGGAVNVFDDISPEKAQAIMFLAGNALIPTPNHPADWAMANQSMNMFLPASSHTIDHSASKRLKRSTSILNKVEPSTVIPPMGSAEASAMLSSAVPQSRKASLARFLEKRKERAMSAMPYNLNVKADECGTPESNGFGFSATSGVCSDICNT